MPKAKPLRVAVLLSGGGTTLENIIGEIASARLPATICLVLSSRRDAYGLTRAENHGIPTAVVPSCQFKRDWNAMSEALNQALEPFEPDLIVLAGFMCLYRIPPRYQGKVMNIHPALIPAFCGKNLYGHHVHEAVIDSGVKVSGCTVHFVDNEYDHGPIITQRTVPVLDDDTPDSLAARVFEQECIAYPRAIRLFAEGKLRIEGNRVRAEES